jgi:hypothetical protein
MIMCCLHSVVSSAKHEFCLQLGQLENTPHQEAYTGAHADCSHTRSATIEGSPISRYS